MPKRLALLLLLFPLTGTLWAQLPVTVTPQQCVWRDGDDAAWAAPTLDETGWHPYAEWKLSGNDRRMWIRCHVDLSGLHGIPNPGAQVGVGSAYQLFINGKRVGGAGNMENGLSTRQVFRWPLAESDLGGPTTLALRLAYRSVLHPDPASIQLGTIAVLKAFNDSMVLTQLNALTLLGVCYLLVGFIGLSLLCLYMSDRSRTELLLLGLACISMVVLRMLMFFRAGQWPGTHTGGHVVFATANILLPISEVWFFFRLAGKRVRQPIPVLLGAVSLWSVAIIVGNCAPFRFALPWLEFLVGPTVFPFLIVLMMVIVTWGAILAFLPLEKLPGRIRIPAGLCVTWIAADFAWFAFELAPGGTRSPLFQRWYNVLAEVRGFTVLAVVIALVALLLREQRQIAEHRALLAGELQAAREIQSMLAPALLETAPGMHVEVAFRPVRDVGGDFYLCRPLGDGRQRLLLGDVSGKGTAAAMTAALIVGGAEDHNDYTPGRLMAHLDRVLRESRVGGFATCVCADVAADGSVTLCNAGHLPPYSAGKEIAVTASLPLGLHHGSTSAYEETTFRLEPGEWLTVLSDGVVEARNATGELFGFDRTLAISSSSAERIATAAESFGQEDDITVLRLRRDRDGLEPKENVTRLSTSPA